MMLKARVGQRGGAYATQRVGCAFALIPEGIHLRPESGRTQTVERLLETVNKGYALELDSIAWWHVAWSADGLLM
jgi:hypothetical protein